MSARLTIPTISTSRAARQLGLSYRQMDYLTRRKLANPIVAAWGSGSYREWTQAELDRIAPIVRVFAVMGLPITDDLFCRLASMPTETVSSIADVFAPPEAIAS